MFDDVWITKLQAVHGKLGEFWAHIAFFGLHSWDGINLKNTQFTTLAMMISDTIDYTPIVQVELKAAEAGNGKIP